MLMFQFRVPLALLRCSTLSSSDFLYPPVPSIGEEVSYFFSSRSTHAGQGRDLCVRERN